jgi:hypothetical protein
LQTQADKPHVSVKRCDGHWDAISVIFCLQQQQIEEEQEEVEGNKKIVLKSIG